MKLTSIKYLTREGLRNIWQNRFMAVASVAVLVACLLLSGIAYVVFENVNNAFNWLYGQNVVVVFAKNECTADEVKAIETSLTNLDNVQTVTFQPKDELLQKYGEELGSSYEMLQGDENPLPDSFIVSFTDLQYFEQTLTQIEAIAGVDEASYDGNIASTLLTVRRVTMAVGGGVVALLLVVSLFIIANTIKLTVYNRRLEIYIMRSVGATDAFIRIPFMVEGMTLGLFSGLFAFFILWFAYGRLLAFFPTSIAFFKLLPFSEIWVIPFVGALCIGTIVGMLGSAIATGKYLHKEGSEKA